VRGGGKGEGVFLSPVQSSHHLKEREESDGYVCTAHKTQPAATSQHLFDLASAALIKNYHHRPLANKLKDIKRGR
jgi:hypothetical protein